MAVAERPVSGKAVRTDRHRGHAFDGIRVVSLVTLTLIVADGLAYLVQAVPVEAVRLPRREVARHWPTAVVAVVIVAAVDTVITRSALRRRSEADAVQPRAGVTRTRHTTIPPMLRIQRVPARIVGVSAAISVVLAAGGSVMLLPLWATVSLALLPWFPVLCVEAVWKHEHYGFYAIFMAIALLQVGHLGEHSVQVLQLLMTHGQLSRSHGVFGQLDFETVHFIWDSAVWLGSGILLRKYGRNTWLWISFAAASVHEVEHVYLFWINMAHVRFYLRGGYTGIMGRGGVIGSPLYRPYLHFAYNYLVVVPMVVAFWDQTKQVYDHYLARTLPSLNREELVAATARTGRLSLATNELLGGQAVQAGSDTHFYIVVRGELELTGPTGGSDRLPAFIGAGQSLRQSELEQGHVVRAVRRTELLILDDSEMDLTERAGGPRGEERGACGSPT